MLRACGNFVPMTTTGTRGTIDREAALAAYERVFRESGRDDRADSIVEDLQRVCAAPTVELAMETIEWWDCWRRGPCHNLRRAVTRLRKLLGAPTDDVAGSN